MPEHLIKNKPCATALNNTVVVFINFNIDSDTDIIPILAYDFSKGVWHSMANPPIQIPNWSALCTCSTMYEKTYTQ